MKANDVLTPFVEKKRSQQLPQSQAAANFQSQPSLNACQASSSNKEDGAQAKQGLSLDQLRLEEEKRVLKEEQRSLEEREENLKREEHEQQERERKIKEREMELLRKQEEVQRFLMEKEKELERERVQVLEYEQQRREELRQLEEQLKESLGQQHRPEREEFLVQYKETMRNKMKDVGIQWGKRNLSKFFERIAYSQKDTLGLIEWMGIMDTILDMRCVSQDIEPGCRTESMELALGMFTDWVNSLSKEEVQNYWSEHIK
ncbi:unnamed protein product [Bursaphelenchus okinawaensis]|uniref:Uncharacterized protein n=1 Tax=Bursaphelenchus okinawaensis TaxID=465554 RepID=A0A811K8T3_9BILA|nr:unnamed protein product [Bursaphelenchus okinawaensis]CAG9095207.1 unnamed protein product [Bursaphelenchus okinawaensis]